MAEPAGTQGDDSSVELGGYKPGGVRPVVLTAPGEARLPDLIVVGLALAGGVCFLDLRACRPDALETEPGDVSVFEH